MRFLELSGDFSPETSRPPKKSEKKIRSQTREKSLKFGISRQKVTVRFFRKSVLHAWAEIALRFEKSGLERDRSSIAGCGLPPYQESVRDLGDFGLNFDPSCTFWKVWFRWISIFFLQVYFREGNKQHTSSWFCEKKIKKSNSTSFKLGLRIHRGAHFCRSKNRLSPCRSFNRENANFFKSARSAFLMRFLELSDDLSL